MFFVFFARETATAKEETLISQTTSETTKKQSTESTWRWEREEIILRNFFWFISSSFDS